MSTTTMSTTTTPFFLPPINHPHAKFHFYPPCKLPTTKLQVSQSPLTSNKNPTSKPNHHHAKLHFYPPTNPPCKPYKSPTNKLQVSSSPSPLTTNKTPTSKPNQETIFFDGGAHYGDLVANLLLGFTLFWLPLTLAAISRAFFLRYRFTNLRVTVISGFTGEDRSDFSYNVIKDVKVVPRFIGEWGDIVITLSDGTKVDLRSVPKFRDIAKYCLSMSRNKQEANVVVEEINAPKGFS